jgi:AcrR family transcriptional regulator
MEAGVAAFSRRGFHSTRVDDIVNRAKTSHGTFYLYFSSKEDLFSQLVAEVAREFHSLTDALPVIADDAGGRAALEEWLRSFVALYDVYGPLIRSWTDAEAPGEGSGVPDLLGTIAAELAAKVRVRASKRFDPGIASLVVVATVERLNYLLATEQLQDSRDRAAEVLAAIAMDAFFGPGH